MGGRVGEGRELQGREGGVLFVGDGGHRGGLESITAHTGFPLAGFETFRAPDS